MAITYTWTIPNVERKLSDGGITAIHWRCTAVDGSHSVASYGTTSHSPNASDSDFIAYDSVTEATCIEWVQKQVDKDVTEENLKKGIDNLKNPTSASGTPW